jgi:DHA2 family methylenomycin A resistance protein-like MFS transporter
MGTRRVVVGGLGASVLAFWGLERRSQAPVLNRALLRSGRVRAGLLAAGGAVLAGAVFADGSYLWLAVGLLMTGFGVSYALPALVAGIVIVAPAGTAGAVGGLLNAVRQVGATLGVAVMCAAIAVGTGWALLLSAAVRAVAWFVFALTGREETTG